MDAKLIAFAIPAFFALILIEYLVNRVRGDSKYVFADSIGNLSCGVGQQVFLLFLGTAKIGAYVWLYENARVATFPTDSVIWWVLAFVFVDFCYYLYHWAGHRVNFFWASHAVHHQSEEYNLAVALRQSWFTAGTSWIFYIPMAILGVSPLMFLTVTTLNTLYQFWIHTRSVHRLGFLEFFMNTPSHHRVHHGINPKYIDKNYAGAFIVWDKLFGTFTPEQEEPVYGTVKPLSSWNAVWANLEPWVRLWKISRKTRRLRDKIWIWFSPPEWLPEDHGGVATIPAVSRDAQIKYRTIVSRGTTLYVFFTFVVVVAAATTLIYFQSTAPLAQWMSAAILILWSLANVAGLLESREWAWPSESARVLAAVAALAYFTANTSWFAPAIGASALLLAAASATFLFGRTLGAPNGQNGDRRSADHLLRHASE